MINQNLPKLYQIDNPAIIKKDPKKITRKLIVAPQLSPVTTSKLISTVDDNSMMKIELNDCDIKNENNSEIKLDDDSPIKESNTEKSNQLNLSIIQDAINILKNNKSRVTKLNIEKIIIRRNSEFNRLEINNFINKCLKDDILEKIKYKEYFGIKFKTKKLDEIEDDEQIELNDELDKSDKSDKSSIDKSLLDKPLLDQEESNLDNLSECSSNINNLNDELDDENDSMYNTKKNALKRCSPKIRYMLRNASDDGLSAAEILKALQAKRLLVQYDLKKMIWLIKTYFVDEGICEQLNNGNYKFIRDNDDIISNKNDDNTTLSNKNDNNVTISNKNDNNTAIATINKNNDNTTTESTNKNNNKATTDKNNDTATINKNNDNTTTATTTKNEKLSIDTNKTIKSTEDEIDLLTDEKLEDEDKLKNNENKINQNMEIDNKFNNDEISNHSDQSSLNLNCFDMNLKRKIDQPPKNNDSLRRPTSQRKKFKKTLGPDFISLDQSSTKIRNSSKQIKNQITTSKSSTIDKQEKQLNLDIDLNETTSIDINVKSDLLEEVPTVDQLKEIEMKNSDILNTPNNLEQLNELNSLIIAESNEDSNLSNQSNQSNQSNKSNKSNRSNQSNKSNQCKSISSLKSTNSNLENSKTIDDNKKLKYGQFYKAYDVHQEAKISKEQFNTLKSLNSYSNGKNPEDWTVDDVVTFITNIGYPNESLIFKNEEIDGRSLLLLRRNDVLTGLSIKLGPALKIYSHIYRLQGSI